MFRGWPSGAACGRGRATRERGGRRAIIMIMVHRAAILAPVLRAPVQLAVNRQREYLADASSVELTRNPYGLERALAKLATDQEPLEVANRATQHLYVVNPIKAFEARQGPLQTHPPSSTASIRLREPDWLRGRLDRRSSPDPAWPRLSRGGCAASSLFACPARRWLPLVRDSSRVAQLVEHATENRGVASSIWLSAPPPGGSWLLGGCGSVGRASPCQGEGRGFESRLPLHSFPGPVHLIPRTPSADPSSRGRTADFGADPCTIPTSTEVDATLGRGPTDSRRVA